MSMSLSLPLLEGLYHNPKASERVLKEALEQWHAAKRIARWISKNYYTQKPSRKRRRGAPDDCIMADDSTATTPTAKTTTATTTNHHNHHVSKETKATPTKAATTTTTTTTTHLHWLFQALSSPVLAVRQTASRIVLQHVHLIPTELFLVQHAHAGDVQCFALLQEFPSSTMHWTWACRALVDCTDHVRLHLLVHYLVTEATTHATQWTDFLWASSSKNKNTINNNNNNNNNNHTNQHASRRLTSNTTIGATAVSAPCHSIAGSASSSPSNIALLTPLACLVCAHCKLQGHAVLTKWLAKLVGSHVETSNSSNASKISAAAAAAARDGGEDAVMVNHNDDDHHHDENHDNDDTHDQEDEMEDAMDEDDEDDDDEEEEEEKGEFVQVEGDVESDEDHEEEEHEEDEEHEDEEEHEEEEHEEEEHEEEHEEEEEDEDEEGVHEDDDEEEVTETGITNTEQEIVDVVRHFEERLLDINEPDVSRPSSSAGATGPPANRKQAYLQAALQVLHASLLEPSAEQFLVQCICNIINPPKKPYSCKIFLRRAPTQEEFFRGSLPKNPINLSQLSKPDPTIRDLRQFIATQLQMAETAELIECMCASKILNLDLPIRVVHQVLWKTHLQENSSSVFSSIAGGFFSTGLVFDRRITADTPNAALPPMVVTYRLIGVDGEATEDTVDELVDPEAPSPAQNSEEEERLLEAKFGATRSVIGDGRGIAVLLRSIQSHVRDTLRRIRRDDVVVRRRKRGRDTNPTLAAFEKSVPCASLVLLKHCTKLPSNRKKLVDARAPTILLRLLLDVLNAIDDSSKTEEMAQIVSNPTAIMLEDLIETLASDISTDDDATEDEMEEGSSTLPLLLSSLKHIYLGPQLRKVIAKLLPFLTYGQSSLARELAENFEVHIKVEKLSDCEAKEQPKTRRFVLMDTFVQAAVSLAPSAVCHSLRSELIKCGFVEKLITFILEDMPDQPPPWSAALWTSSTKKGDVADLEQSWKYYFLRTGIKTAFDMLVGLCRGHDELQKLVATFDRFVNACHWIESTSDNKTVRIYLNGMGILAETLLDELKEDSVSTMVSAIRRKTRDRKKEIADERRSKALVSMASSYNTDEKPARSILAPVLDFFNPSGETPAGQPAWLAEMEALEDETGLTCAVCQEGRTLQPAELLGLYCYVKKVSIAQNKGGGRPFIEGAMLLIALPNSLPTSLVDTPVEHHWYSLAKSTGDSLRSSYASYLSASTSGRRPTQITTTVSAGNAIHCSCHSKARAADRNHPKAPKSEWEGASLRNSRVNCNVILPLVSSKSSKVPLVAVDMALTDYQTAIANLLGARPKAMLWAVLNDVRLLLLRMAYGEALNADCGGGSMSSNAALLFYQLLLADMFTNDAEHDSPETARHARCLSGGFLAASKILQAEDFDDTGKSSQPSLTRVIADAAPMAALTCIVYHNTKDEASTEPEKDAMVPHPKRRWELNKEEFLCGLISCAGRRHALGIEDSGVQTSRKGRPRQSSFSEWDMLEDDEGESDGPPAKRAKGPTSIMGKRGMIKIEDFAIALRPMITLYAIFDAMSTTYVPNLTDEMIEESAAVLAKQVEGCQKAKGIHELLRKAGVELEHDRIIEELQKGMMSA